MEYPIKINARINKKQYDRIKESGVSKSEYIRDAIEFFNSDSRKDVELSKIKLISKIFDRLDLEKDKFDEFVKRHDEEEMSIRSTLQREYEECEDRLNKIKEEEMKYSDVNVVKPRRVTSEEVILNALPTLQGFYYSETGITYDKIRVLAFRINISPEVLMNWVDQNEELIRGSTYQDRPALKHQDISLKRYDK